MTGSAQPVEAADAGRPYRFLAIGAVCAIAGNLLVWALAQLAGINYLAAFVLAFFIVNYLGFLLNKFFTFRRKDTGTHAELTRYYLAMFASLLLNLGCLYLLVDILHMHLQISCLLLTVAFPPINYVLHRFWTFRGDGVAP